MIRVQIIGDAAASERFRELGIKLRDLSAAWERIGAKISDDAQTLAPVGTLAEGDEHPGRLVASIRAGAAKTRAVVRAGSKGRGVEYAGVINYGWPAHNIEADYFLNEALVGNRDTAEDEVHDEINTLIRRVF